MKGKPMNRALFAAVLPLCLAGCSLGLSGKAPPFLLTLVPSERPAADEGSSGDAASALAIGVPTAPAAIAVARIPVAKGGTAIAYVTDGVWVEPPARLFQRLLAETVRAKNGRPVIEGREATLSTDTLTGTLLRFDIEESSLEAVVTYQATYHERGKRGVLYRRFEARAPVSRIEAAPAGQALNKAANQVAGEVAAWVSK